MLSQNDLFDPLLSPFQLPVKIIQVRCQFKRPFKFNRKPGSTIRGTFKKAVLESCCEKYTERRQKTNNDRQAAHPCQVITLGKKKKEKTELKCQCPVTCSATWLYGFHSDNQGRDLAPPVRFLTRDFISKPIEKDFTLEISLLGRRAIAYEKDVLQAVHYMGKLGFSSVKGKDNTPFEVIGVQPSGLPKTLKEYGDELLKKWLDAGKRPLLIEFPTPYTQEETVINAKAEKSKQVFVEGYKLKLPALFGNFGYDLASLEMEDNGYIQNKDRLFLNDLCDLTREIARRVGNGLNIKQGRFKEVEGMMQYSRSTDTIRELLATCGYIILEGNLEQAIPWLAAISLCGAGQDKAIGFGEITIWV